MSSARTLKLTGIVGVLLPAIFISIFPLIIMVSTSFKTSQEVYIPPPTFLPREPTAQNYVDIWSVAPLTTYFRNSMVIGLGSTILALLLAIPAAFVVSGLAGIGIERGVIFLLGIQMFPPVVIILGIFRVVVGLNMVDSLATVVALNAIFSLSFAIWMLSGYFATIPPEIEEAA
ncbi:MAG: carbohydrate ABC transporter permease, partial [Caldilineaceae bacterium]|nr:carbohydrate ABC transporter permease [Caldilineaceae bacterium]